MQRCPTCNKTFTNQQLSFCTDDGTPLVSVEVPEDATEDEVTRVSPSPRDSETDDSRPAGASESDSLPPYQPPGSYNPRDYSGQSKRRTWPWLVGILGLVFLLFAGLLIAGAFLIPKMMRAANTNSHNLNANIQGTNSNSNLSGPNFNSNSNSREGNESGNDTSGGADTTPAPADDEKVLQELTDLEQEWTVANINADKKKLDRILADDYVGESPDGTRQGKAEYLRTAKRDTAIQEWNFEDLKLSLTGDRATLSGIIRLDVKDEHGQNQNLAFRFTDKFVWRDGHWQATGSVVTPLNEGTRN